MVSLKAHDRGEFAAQLVTDPFIEILGPEKSLHMGLKSPEKSWFSPIKSCNLEPKQKVLKSPDLGQKRPEKSWKTPKQLKMSKKISWIVQISEKPRIWSKFSQIMVNWSDLGPKALCCGQKISNEDSFKVSSSLIF